MSSGRFSRSGTKPIDLHNRGGMRMSLDDYLKQLLGDIEEEVGMSSEPAFQFSLPVPEEDGDA